MNGIMMGDHPVFPVCGIVTAASLPYLEMISGIASQRTSSLYSGINSYSRDHKTTTAMIKKINLIVLLICCAIAALSQATGNNTVRLDTISYRTYYKKMNQAFGALATGEGNAVNLADYGSVDPSNSSFKFNLYGPLDTSHYKKISFFSVNAGGDLSGDNLGVLFNNSKFNSGMNIGGKIYIPLNGREIHTSGLQEDSITEQIRLLLNQEKKDTTLMILNTDPVFIRNSYRNDSLQLENLGRKLISSRHAMDSVNSLIPGLSRPADSEMLRRTTDTSIVLYKKISEMIIDSIRLNIRKDSLDSFLIIRTRMDSVLNIRLYEITSATAKKRESLENALTVGGGAFRWISFVGSYTRKKYYTFIDSLSFASQFTKNKFSSWSFGIELNIFGFAGKKQSFLTGPLRTYYLNLGLLRLRDNNTADLSTTELTDSRKFASGDSAHGLSTKYNVYTENIKEYQAWKLYFNYYLLIGKNRNMAIHIFPDVEFRDTHEKPFDIGAGLIFSLKNKKDNATFNIEAYAKFVDIGKALPSDEKSLFNRNEIGINFTVPINF